MKNNPAPLLPKGLGTTSVAFEGVAGKREFKGTLEFYGQPPFNIDLQPEEISITMLGKVRRVRFLMELE